MVVAMRSRLPILVSLLSIPVAGAVLLLLFGPGAILRALDHANLLLLAVAFILGIVIQVIKAERAAMMLSEERPVTFLQSFGTMVVSYGIGHFVPFGPAALALRSILIRRVTGNSMVFSAGVFLAADVLDKVTLLPLVAYLLLTVKLRAWEEVILTGIAVQYSLFLLIPFVARLIGHGAAHRQKAARSGLIGAVWQVVRSLSAGLATVTSRGPRYALVIVALSLASTTLAVIRLACLIGSFAITANRDQLFLLMLLGGLVGSIPIHIPGTGVWAASKLARSIGIIGPGLGAYIFISTGIDSIETPLLALAVLIWWSVTANGISVQEIIAAIRHPQRALKSLPAGEQQK